jgi:cytochrome o ubiquinol oxidase subunit 1
MGATRRMQHYPDAHWQPLMLVALSGAVLILAGIALTVIQLVVSIRTRDRRRDLTGDPWSGRTLEWSTPSPPPAWNFALLSTVESTDAYWAAKRQGQAPGRLASARPSVALHIPRSNPTGFFLAFFAVALGFALIWHIWWLAIAGLLGAVIVGLRQAWRTDTEREISAEEVAAFYETSAPEEIAA